jgi:hypothetical protein
VGRIFDRRIAPLAGRLRDRGVRFFPMGPEADAESWYVRPARGELEFVELDGPDACEKALRELWQRQDMPELDALAGELIDLARRLEIREEDAGEISPFVYVMY